MRFLFYFIEANTNTITIVDNNYLYLVGQMLAYRIALFQTFQFEKNKKMLKYSIDNFYTSL